MDAKPSQRQVGMEACTERAIKAEFASVRARLAELGARAMLRFDVSAGLQRKQEEMLKKLVDVVQMQVQARAVRLQHPL